MNKAQEWLEKEEIDSLRDNCKNVNYATSTLMEKYKNNCTAELQAKILEFRNKLKKGDTYLHDLLLMEYDEHFGIEKNRGDDTK